MTAVAIGIDKRSARNADGHVKDQVDEDNKSGESVAICVLRLSIEGNHVLVFVLIRIVHVVTDIYSRGIFSSGQGALRPCSNSSLSASVIATCVSKGGADWSNRALSWTSASRRLLKSIWVFYVMYMTSRFGGAEFFSLVDISI